MIYQQCFVVYFVISNKILSDFFFCIKLAHIASAVFLVCYVYISLSLICNELIHNSVTRTQYKIHALYNSTNMATMWTCYFLLNESFMAQYETWIKYQWSYSISLAYKKTVTQKIKSSNGRLWGCQTGAKSEHPKVVQNSSFEWVVEWLL